MKLRGLPALIALSITASAIAETSRQDDFNTSIAKLPTCDRVEVIRIGAPGMDYVPVEGKEGRLRKVLLDDKSKLYHVEPYDEWWKIDATHTVKGPEAEKIAAFLRAFKPMIRERKTENGMVSFRGSAKCHFPPFAYRFYAGDKLLYDTSVCWGCENLIVGPDEKRRFFYFDTGAKEAKELLAASEKLFPDHPVPKAK